MQIKKVLISFRREWKFTGSPISVDGHLIRGLEEQLILVNLFNFSSKCVDISKTSQRNF